MSRLPVILGAIIAAIVIALIGILMLAGGLYLFNNIIGGEELSFEEILAMFVFWEVFK